MTNKHACEHAKNVDDNIAPKTSGCEECEKEGTDWVALRMCLSCGHVDAVTHLLAYMRQDTLRKQATL